MLRFILILKIDLSILNNHPHVVSELCDFAAQHGGMKLDFENRDPAACCIPKQAT
jgi:hypothetical protein